MDPSGGPRHDPWTPARCRRRSQYDVDSVHRDRPGLAEDPTWRRIRSFPTGYSEVARASHRAGSEEHPPSGRAKTPDAREHRVCRVQHATPLSGRNRRFTEHGRGRFSPAYTRNGVGIRYDRGQNRWFNWWLGSMAAARPVHSSLLIVRSDVLAATDSRPGMGGPGVRRPQPET